MKNKTLDKFVYATQYYRAPTPLPEEWDVDLRSMVDTVGIDTIQFRVQWRWNEPAEGKFFFDDLDRLFELAEKYNKKVLFKFLLENAPDYIYNRYGGTRCDMHGNPLRPLAHGAYYCGGWLPCFDNPEVVRKAEEFTRVMVERYKKRSGLLLWNVWNEPMSRPIGECGCQHSIKVYRQWLQDKYSSIKVLNDFLGKRWESFETIEPPGSPSDFAELYIWRQWAMSAVQQRVKFMYDVVKGIDPERPVITHVGGCSILQDVAGGGSDDVMNAEVVDFYGCSLPTVNIFSNPINDCWPALQCDWLRSVSEYYWIYELYPDWGAWQAQVRLGDYKFKVFTPLACGAKGIVYWQYRAERVGMENNLSGLVNIDGSSKGVSHESAKIAEFIHKYQDFLIQAKVKPGKIAIVYSVSSDLINRIENTGKDNFWDFSLNSPDGLYLYKKALCGIYALFRELGYTVDWLDSRSLPERSQNYELIYLPEFFMPSTEETTSLLDYAAAGGKLIAEEGLGLRQPNTWVHKSWPEASFRKLFGVKIDDRVLGEFQSDTIRMGRANIVPAADNFISYLTAEEGEEIGQWTNGTAIVKKDNCVFIGTSLGAVFHDSWDSQRDDCLIIMTEILAKLNAPLPKFSLPKGVYIRELLANGIKMSFVFNRNETAVEFEFFDNLGLTPCYGDIQIIDERIKIAAWEIGVFMEK